MKRRLPLPDSSVHGRASDGTSAYSVGYCRPPLHTRFRPGKSGNPKGRPRGRKNLRTIVENGLKEPVKITVGDKTRIVSKAEALVLTWINAALQGDVKAAALVINLMRVTGHLDEELTADSPVLSEQQAALLFQDYVARNPPPRQRPARRRQEGGSK
jgi:hypothetical protein